MHGQFDARRRPSLKRPRRVSLKVFGSEDWRTKSATHRVRRARSLLVFSARPRTLSLSLPVYSVSYSRFVLPACFSLSLFPSSSYSIFAGRYKMSYGYEAHIARREETRSVFTKPSLVFVIFSLLVNHASSRCAFVSVIVKRE